MSYSSLYGVPEKGSIKCLKEYRNSWGTAPRVWDVLFDSHLKDPDIPYDNMMSRMHDLWPLYKDEKVPEYQRKMLQLTYDKLILKKEYFSKVIKLIEEFSEKHLGDDTKVNHWPQIAKDLKDMDFSNYVGVCFIWTSVASDVWDSYDKCTACFEQKCENEDHYDSEDGKVWRKWDISKDDDHWFMFEG